MKTDGLEPVYADPGPFASVYIDISRDMEDGDHVVELQARGVCDQLRDQGAPPTPGLAFGAVTAVAPEVTADRALIAAAVTTSADVVVTPTRTLGGAPAAALLRWDQASVGSQA